MHVRASMIAIVLSCASLNAAVSIQSFTPSLSSPQPVGTPVTFTATGTDTGSGPLTFQFNVAFRSGTFSVVRNFNIGTLSGTTWTSQPFVWATIATEGSYTVQVVAKDFSSGATATANFPFTLTTLVSGGKLSVVPTANALVELAAIPPCPLGSQTRAVFRPASAQLTTHTGFVRCNGATSSNVYLGGLHASTAYAVSYQTETGGKVTVGTSGATFTSGAVPASFPLPVVDVVEPPSSGAYLTDDVVLHFYINLGATSNQPMATDLQGHPVWYYQSGDNGILMTRPIPNGYFYALESGIAWSTGATVDYQLLREIDLAGNVVKESNIGLMQQQLLAMGATNLQPCGNVPVPVPVGAGCLASLSHDQILLPNGDVAFLAVTEKIFPPGTQGNTSGLNVDVLGDAVIVVDTNLNVAWYWDSFEHDGGGTQLDINRAATLADTCTQTAGGCGPLFLYGTPNVAAPANDWLHANSIYFEPSDQDFIVSLRSQDWVIKIDYNNGAGTGNILWRLGLDGDFSFNNINNDPYPWFSHQHEVGIETNGVMTLFDNGNTRVAVEGSGNSRGMALNVDQSALTVTPVLSQDLGYYAFALGSAQLLPNGNYHFQPGVVSPSDYSYSLEYVPVAGTTGGTEVYNLEGEAVSYRSFRMPDLYTPPTT